MVFEVPPHQPAITALSLYLLVSAVNVGNIFVDEHGQQIFLRPVEEIPPREVKKKIAAEIVGPVASLVKQLEQHRVAAEQRAYRAGQQTSRM